jgi:uncharacterized protein
MMQLPITPGLVCLLLLLTAGAATAGGIDCAKAKTPVEKLLCADPALKKADAGVADAFDQALNASPDQQGVRASQRDWLKTRNACPDAACLAEVHAKRQAELTAMASEGLKKSAAERARLRTMLGWPNECETSFQELLSPDGRDMPSLGTGVEPHALGDGRTLYAVQCEQAAYQGAFVVLLQDKPDGPGRLLQFPQYDTDGKKVIRSVDANLAGELAFNDKTKELTVFAKARGLGDCGSLVRYAFPPTGDPTVGEARIRACSDRSVQHYQDPTKWDLVKKP